MTMQPLDFLDCPMITICPTCLKKSLKLHLYLWVSCCFTANISLNSIANLIFEMSCVFFAVRTQLLIIISTSSHIKGLNCRQSLITSFKFSFRKKSIASDMSAYR